MHSRNIATPTHPYPTPHSDGARTLRNTVSSPKLFIPSWKSAYGRSLAAAKHFKRHWAHLPLLLPDPRAVSSVRLRVLRQRALRVEVANGDSLTADTPPTPGWAGPDHGNGLNRNGGGAGGGSRRNANFGSFLFSDDITMTGCWTWGTDSIPTFGARPDGYYANLDKDNVRTTQDTTQDEPSTSTAVTRANNSTE